MPAQEPSAGLPDAMKDLINFMTISVKVVKPSAGTANIIQQE